MAMSISGPDPASPTQVADASFSTSRRGFDQHEVRDFLRTVSAELGRLREREAFLQRELSEAQVNPDLDGARLDDEALTRLLGEETARVLNAARESSHEIREKAEQSAARMLLEASDEATRMREEAEIEASRRRSDAASDAEAELSMAKQQGREMVTEARAYRERVLSELARRRELAREQIEQLVHGRDRLMQAFERARLVAVDVVSEMQPLGEPDEYVNLQASTGPVPVMVARDDTALPDARDTQVEAGTLAAGLAEDGVEAATDGAIEAGIGDAVSVEESIVRAPYAEGVGADPSADVDVTASDDVAASDDVDELDEGGVENSDAAGESLMDDQDVDDSTRAGLSDGQAADAGLARESDVEEPTDAHPEGRVSDEEDLFDVDDALEPASELADGGNEAVVVDLFARLRADATASGPRPDDERGLFGSNPEPLEPGPAAPTGRDEFVATESHDETHGEVPVDAVGEDETPFERRDAALTPLIVASARKLKRVLADEQNEVLDALRRSDPVRDLDALLPWAAHHGERYATAIAEELLLAANAGAALTHPGRTPALRKAAGEQAVDEASQKLGQWLVQPLRDRLERCVSEGDGDNEAITQKARATYRECKTRHIDEQLDDVLRVAHGRGLLAAIELDTPIEWAPDPDHDVCADCDDNRLAGAIPAGQPFPTGQACSPAHPGCRCMLVPVAR